MTVTNINTTVTFTNPVLYVLTQTDSYLHMGDTVTRSAGIALSPEATYVSYDNIAEYYGGGLKDSVMKLLPYIQKLNNYLKESGIISKTVGMVQHPIAQSISGIAKQAGYGAGGGLEEVSGMVAGKLMTNAEIKKRIKKLK